MAERISLLHTLDSVKSQTVRINGKPWKILSNQLKMLNQVKPAFRKESWTIKKGEKIHIRKERCNTSLPRTHSIQEEHCVCRLPED